MHKPIEYTPAPTLQLAAGDRRRHHATRDRVNELKAEGWKEFCRDPLVLVRGIKRIEVRANGAVIHD